jgi:hypothetical protein
VPGVQGIQADQDDVRPGFTSAGRGQSRRRDRPMTER